MVIESTTTSSAIDREIDANGAIVIDDSGTPGTAARSSFLHLNRKTWAAVIIQPAVTARIRHALQIFIDGVRGDYGVDELHFADIYNGRGAFKNVPIEKRYEIFDLMAELFRACTLPIVIQTCSPRFLTEIRASMTTPLPNLNWFDLNNHEHVALLFLLCQVRMFVREQRDALPRALSVVIDEGPMKAGSTLSMPQWSDLFAGGRATFHRSHEMPFLQLADFAAFAVARTQWLVSSGIRKPRDLDFLKIVSAERLWYVNLPAGQIIPTEASAEQYERILKADRISKGLPPDPPT